MSEFNAELEETSGTILETVISNIVDKYHKEHPTGGGITQDELAQAITSYFTEHPIDTVSDDDINSIIEGYFNEHPVSGGISKDDVLNIIDEYENGKNLFDVKEGTYTQDGVTVVAQNGELIINGTAESVIEFSNIINVSNEVIFGDITITYACYLLNDMANGNSDIFIEMGSNVFSSYIPILFKNDDNSNATPILRILPRKYENVHITPVLKLMGNGTKMTNYCERMYTKAALFPTEVDFLLQDQSHDGVDIALAHVENGKLVLSINGTIEETTEVRIQPIFSVFITTYIVYVNGANTLINNTPINDGQSGKILINPFANKIIRVALEPDTYNNKTVSIRFVNARSLQGYEATDRELADRIKKISGE